MRRNLTEQIAERVETAKRRFEKRLIACPTCAAEYESDRLAGGRNSVTIVCKCGASFDASRSVGLGWRVARTRLRAIP
jgi:transcription elongation factor Elf1